MMFKKYFSNHLLMRLLLLIALISSAAMVDMYLSANQKLAGALSKLPEQNEEEVSKVFYCNPVNTFNLKTPASEFSVRFKLACTQDKFLLKHYNLRTHQLMKAESLHSAFPVCNSFHSLPFNRVLYASPDDNPPLS